MFILRDVAHPDGVIKNCCCQNYLGRCKIGQQRCTYSGCICYDVADYALVYDSRASMILLGTVTIGSLGFPGIGQTVTGFGIAWTRVSPDEKVLNPQPPLACPQSCTCSTPAALLRGIFYRCDYP